MGYLLEVHEIYDIAQGMNKFRIDIQKSFWQKNCKMVTFTCDINVNSTVAHVSYGMPFLT